MNAISILLIILIVMIIVGTIVGEVLFWFRAKKKNNGMAAFYIKSIVTIMMVTVMAMGLSRTFDNVKNNDWIETEATVSIDNSRSYDSEECTYSTSLGMVECKTIHVYVYRYSYTDKRTGIEYSSDWLYSRGLLPKVNAVRFDPEYPQNSVERGFLEDNLTNVLSVCLCAVITIGVWLIPEIVEMIKNGKKSKNKKKK